MKEVKKETKVEPKPTIPEVIENLKIQLNHHQTMVVKTQGAIEVLTQIEES